jgi:membrane-bound metal-dependent hydrolase YbcI (DUF457 family)
VLGHSHATSGALVWAAAAAVVPAHVMGIHLGTSDMLLGTFVCSGAALLPDIDHPDGTIAHFLGPISHALCRFIEWISGGHRHGTHSLLFAALVSFGTWEGTHHLGRPFTLALVYVLLSLAVRALHLCPPGKGIHSWGTVVVLAAAGTAAADRWITATPAWMPIAVGLGTLAHLAGDCLTKEGCPLLWPVPVRFGVPLIRHTGNKLETLVLSPAMTVGACALLWFSTAPGHIGR